MAVDEPTARRRFPVTALQTALAALVLVVAAAGLSLWSAVSRPYTGFERPVILRIARGLGSRQVASLLASRGIVRNRWLFLAVRAFRSRDILQAGEYRFASPSSAREVYDRLVRGDVFYYKLTVPEGSSVFDTARIIAGMDWISEAEALAAVTDPAPIADLAPQAATLEGFLFPSTYAVTRGTSAAAICGMMVTEFRRRWRSFGAEADPYQTVTLASLVEKETGVDEERPLVAGVFHNRLERGLKLECDPTVIYAALLEDHYDGVIHRSDLDNPHPYNTYQHPGLPPGPIASPGEAALRATLHPAKTDFVFFVAKPDGSGAHEFSRTVSAHNRAVARYRRGIQEKKRQERAKRISQPERHGEGH